MTGPAYMGLGVGGGGGGVWRESGVGRGRGSVEGEWGGGGGVGRGEGEGDLAMKGRQRVAIRTVNNNSIPFPGPSHYSELDSYENLIGWRDCHGGIGFGGLLQGHPLRGFFL